MKLYKYRSIDKENLWFSLDIIFNNRLYGADWNTLNDPMEGRYEIAFITNNDSIKKNINTNRNNIKICSLSKNYDNFLLWSHYANNHKGIVIEIDISEDDPNLKKINYGTFSPLITHPDQKNDDTSYLFAIKNTFWKYEEEYRLIKNSIEKINNQDKFFFPLDKKINKIYLGAKMEDEQKDLLRKILSKEIELIETSIDLKNGKIIRK